ncbi:MAG: DUF4160 domain-containing protein [Caldilineae bacterium]|nr:MAG: DUF4160 domain-containing protein [Caldilineae bacterium]
MSPTVHRERGYVFYFVSFDVASGEPPHVHVGKGRPQPGRDAKVWLSPVRVASYGRFNRSDMQRLLLIVEQRQSTLLEAWNEYQKRVD